MNGRVGTASELARVAGGSSPGRAPSMSSANLGGPCPLCNQRLTTDAIAQGLGVCRVALPPTPEDDRLVEGQESEDGSITEIHHLYTDPPLTDCSRSQSSQAGRSFLSWLRSTGTRVDFIGSSFLSRAIETAYAMFVKPCDGGGATCSGVVEDGIGREVDASGIFSWRSVWRGGQ